MTLIAISAKRPFHNLSWLLLLLLVGQQARDGVYGLICDRTPEGMSAPKMRADNRFAIEIRGNPQTYSPGEMYTVSLVGSGRALKGPAKFSWFSLSVETSSRSGATSPGVLYFFGDSLTKFNEDCPNTITASSLSPKTEVQALWTAPMQGTGCVIFRATVVERKDVWYQDDGPLSKTLCEDLQQSSDEQPQVNQQCCACEEAKYEVSFEGLWSRQTHPKDFPDNLVTRFSDVIGASHTTEYRFWEYGGRASEGLKQVAELGSTRMLESELKSQSQNIRTIIKARGISYPNVTSKTFAVFRVDSRHHLMSLVSMIDPSPDWIVGVSALELCLTNCSWLETKVLNLYPWDAGTDSGITYTSPDVPTEPQDHIRRITTSFPADPRSPFYDPNGEEMKPLARLYLTRQRLYEKSCTDGNAEVNINEACEVGEWSEWSDCSVTCGNGKRTRQRFYKDEALASRSGCNRQITSRSTCYAPLPCKDSSPKTGQDSEEADSMCATTEWSKWSGCSVSCGKGVKTRFRNLKHRKNWKKCMASVGPVMKQDDVCMGAAGDCDVQVQGETAPLTSACAIGAWSEWSACSVSCGQGVRERVREVTAARPDALKYCSQSVKTVESVSCSDLTDCNLLPDQARDVCQLPKDVGDCRGSFERWHFDMATQACRKFMYTGCRGNRNTFKTQEQCEATCSQLMENDLTTLPAEPTTDGPFGGLESKSQIWTSREPATFSGAVGPVVDCKVSHWSPWSECSVSCGRGLRTKTRHIMVNSRNGGRPCPRKLLRRKKCNSGPCTGFIRDDPDSLDEYDDDSQEECVYSEWSPWSLCSATCGLNSVQQRSRSLDVARTPASATSSCLDRLETRVCNVFPCRTINIKK